MYTNRKSSQERRMDIDFIKMHGTGNDYIYLDLFKNRYNIDFSRLAQQMAPRHFGIGADGLILIMESVSCDFRMRMFNADGSEAEMCGNGIRCVGKFVYDIGYTKKRAFTVETKAGEKVISVVELDGAGKASSIRVDMGRPVLSGRDIPVTFDREPVVDVEILGYRGIAVSMGNPHFITFVDNITDSMVLTDGPQLEKAIEFPKKANIEFVQILDRNNVVMRVWERGTGETLACGTGACAVVVAGVLGGLTDRSVQVKVRGGALAIRWDEQNDTVYLCGPAVEVFRGVYSIK